MISNVASTLDSDVIIRASQFSDVMSNIAAIATTALTVSDISDIASAVKVKLSSDLSDILSGVTEASDGQLPIYDAEGNITGYREG